MNEELARVTRFFGWDAERWVERAVMYTARLESPLHYNDTTHPLIQERDHKARQILLLGKVAYAHRQATIRETLRQDAEFQFETMHPKLSRMNDGTDASILYECV